MNDTTRARDTADKPRVLIIDDEAGHVEAEAEVLERSGVLCETATSGEEGITRVRDTTFDVVVTDLMMHGMDGMAVLAAAKRTDACPAVIVVTGYGSIESAVRAMKDGAGNYLTKPINPEELRQVVRNAADNVALRRRNLELEKQLDERFGFAGIIGNSEPMKRVFDRLRQVAPTEATVLVLGESGTGKELIAKAVHTNSPRRSHSFVALNCAALSESILESELFGHEKGAFTGAMARRQGRFEYAHRGTLFLDEIGDMPASTQIKLLRVIEEKEITRVGSNEPVKVDVRLLGATHQNLETLVKQGKFREDLYYRMNVVRIELPPLRERSDDIPLLASAFIDEFNETHCKHVEGIAPDALDLLMRYPWPGNVRELKNCIESMVVVSGGGLLTPGNLPHKIRDDQSAEGGAPQLAGRSLEDTERELIIQTLQLTGGNRQEAAKRLKIGERTLYRKLDKYSVK